MANEYSFSVHTFDDEIEHAPYDWKRKPVGTPQSVLLERMATSDTILNVFSMLTLRDVFALTFVSKHIRELVIDKSRKTKYITQRSRTILLHILSAALKNHMSEFLEMMRDHKLYIGGSSILHGILYERGFSWNTEVENPDLDVYVKTDAEFRMMKPKLDAMFTPEKQPGNANKAYGSWFYGSWKATHNYGVGVSDTCEIDVINANNGIECYDLTVCQNSIDWEGRMRCINPYDIVHGEMRISLLFENKLRDMIGYGIQMSNDLYFSVPREMRRRGLRVIIGNLSQMAINMVRRIKKYNSRGFMLLTPVIKYFNSRTSLMEEFLNALHYGQLDDVDLTGEVKQLQPQPQSQPQPEVIRYDDVSDDDESADQQPVVAPVVSVPLTAPDVPFYPMYCDYNKCSTLHCSNDTHYHNFS